MVDLVGFPSPTSSRSSGIISDHRMMKKIKMNQRNHKGKGKPEKYSITTTWVVRSAASKTSKNTCSARTHSPI